MASTPQAWPNNAGLGLLDQAARILAQETQGRGAKDYGAGSGAMPSLPLGLNELAGRTCPVVGASTPMPGAPKGDVRQQAHELLAAVLAGLGTSYGAAPGHATPPPFTADRSCPITKASFPPVWDKDALRRQAHEFIDTLLVTFRQATSEDGLVAENKVPHLECVAPVQAGGIARASLTVINEEPTPSDVTLYATNFTGDTGFDIPALRVSVSPRVVTLEAGEKASFDIKVSVPAQTPAGAYAGLLQAFGSKYVKAVLTLQVI